jgi:cytochrome c nitrite reductase small subunit
MTGWTLTAAAGGVLLGVAAGVGGYTFVYARGASYLRDDPAACANCHVMGDHFAAWGRSSHHGVATCNDCHTPASLVPKYLVKASNGFWHSYAFTTGDFPEPLRIKPGNRAVTEGACRACHRDIVDQIDPATDVEHGALPCLGCHRDVGHLH